MESRVKSARIHRVSGGNFTGFEIRTMAWRLPEFVGFPIAAAFHNSDDSCRIKPPTILAQSDAHTALSTFIRDFAALQFEVAAKRNISGIGILSDPGLWGEK
jgi:hypothetical protein